MREEYLYLKKKIENAGGFMQYLPLTVDCIKEGFVKATLQVTEQLYNPFGTVHGGCLFTVADSVAGAAALTHGKYVTTLSGNIHYLRSVADIKKLYITANEVKAGKTILAYDVVFTDEEKNTICKVILEYFALNDMKWKM